MAASLLNTYLLAGPYYPKADEPIAPGSLELVTDRFFGMKGKQDYTLLVTDEFGILRSVNADLVPSGQPKQHPPRQPLSLYLIPPGVVRACFFANAQSWQSEIMGEFNDLVNDDGLKLKPLTTLSVTFEKQHLKAPEDADAKEAFDKEFADGQVFNGQLIKKNRMAIFVVSSKVFGKKGKSVFLINSKGVKCFPIESADDEPIEYESGLNEQTVSGNFRMFYLSSLTAPLEEGHYVFTIPLENLNKNLQNWCNICGVKNLSYSVEIKFSITSLIGDFDFHVLDPITIEDALMAQFPEKFETVKQSIVSSESQESTPETKEKESALKTWKEKYEAGAEKSELISGYMEHNSRATRLPKYCSYFITAANAFFKAREDNESGKWVQLFSDNFYAIFHTKEAIKKYKEFIDKQIPKLKQAMESFAVDGQWISKRFASTPIRKYAIEAIGSKNKMVRRLGALDVHRFKTDPGYAAKAKRLIMLDGMSAKDVTMFKAFKKVAGAALSTMNTAAGIYEFAALIKDRSETKEKLELCKNRFTAGAKNYHKKFAAHPSLIGISRLEALRKRADTAAIELADKDRELLESAIDTALNLAVYVPVPMVQEAAGLVILGKAALQASGTVIGTIAKDLDRGCFDSMLEDFMERKDRLDVLEKEYVACIKALKEKKNSPDDPEVQFRVRAAILIGLIRLIERCGSRYDKESNKTKFEDKVKQYDIEGYINSFIFNPPSKQAHLSLLMEIPIDELWLFCRGNKSDFALAAAERAYKLIKEKWYAIPLVLAAPETGVAAAAYELTTAANIPVKFQKQFPIHAKDSDTIVQLARVLSTNYSGIKADDFEFTCVYARKQGGKWEPVEEFANNKANPRITPFTEIRVVIVLKGKNLAGLPLSLQLFRTYWTKLWPDAGPVYKGMALRLEASDNNDGLDKGLLKGTAEEPYISTETTSHYGFVFHPFYYFGNAIIKGTKPCSFIGMVNDPVITMGFKIGAGDKPSFEVVTGYSKKTEYEVKLFLKEPVFVSMVLDTAFLENKSTKPTEYKVIDAYSKQTYLCGIFFKRGPMWTFYHDWERLGAGKEFDFAWDKPFEMIFLFSAPSISAQWAEAEEIRFPINATVFEEGLWDSPGPSYGVEAVCLNKYKGYTRFDSQHLIFDTVKGTLRSKGLVKPEETIGWTDYSAESMVKIEEANYLFASRASFLYSVGDDDGVQQPYNRLKPFGDKFISQGQGNYNYGFRIASQVYGLKELKSPYLMLPGLPDASTFKFPINQKFVTSSTLKKELNIQKSDF